MARRGDANRIIYVVNHAGYFLTHRLRLALAARDEGYEVHVATPRSRHVPEIEKAGLGWHPIRLTRSGVHPVGEIRTLTSLIALYRRLRPDLVHQVTSKPVLYGTLAARMTGVPAVVGALAGLGHLHLADDFQHRAIRKLVGLGYRLSLSHPNMQVIFQNEDDRRAFVESGWLEMSQTVLVRGSGVDPDVFVPGKTRGGEVPVVLFPSRMLRTKGLIELIEAARLLRREGVQARFVLVGDPDPDNPASVEESEIMEWVSEGLVEYRGRVLDMAPVFAEADLVVLPSYREGMPKSLIEASSSGVASITTDVPGCRDVIEDGVNGRLVPVRAVEPLAVAIRELLDDPDERVRMGEKGRRKVIESLSLDIVIRETLAIYEGLLR